MLKQQQPNSTMEHIIFVEHDIFSFGLRGNV